MIRITFDVDDLWRDVLRAVADRVNDDAATHRTIRTRAASLRRTIDLQTLRLGVNRSKIKAERG